MAHTGLRPEHRFQVLEQHAVHVALPTEVRRQLAENIFQMAQQAGYLPATPEPYDRTEPQLSLGYGFADDGEPQVRMRVKRPRRILDIRLRLLSVVARAWLRDTRRQASEDAGERWIQGCPLLIFNFLPYSVLDREATVLVRVRQGAQLSWWQRLLVRRALVLRRASRRQHWISTDALLKDLCSEAVTQARTGDEAGFRDALLAAVRLHLTLLQAAHFEHEGEAQNMARLGHLFGTRHQGWQGAYDPILLAVADTLWERSAAFDTCGYISSWLLRETGMLSIDVQQDLLDIPMHLHAFLLQRWRQRVEDQGRHHHDAAVAAELVPPGSGTYGRVLRHFAYAWEQTEPHIPGMKERSGATPETVWRANQTHYRLLARFVERSVEMVLRAVAAGDIQGARVLASSFLNWRAEKDIDFDRRRLLTAPWTRTIEILDLPLDERSRCCRPCTRRTMPTRSQRSMTSPWADSWPTGRTCACSPCCCCWVGPDGAIRASPRWRSHSRCCGENQPSTVQAGGFARSDRGIDA